MSQWLVVADSRLPTRREMRAHEVLLHRPELIAKSDAERYAEAVHHAAPARQLLTSHANVARESPDGMARRFALRDAMMADNLACIISRERNRGAVIGSAVSLSDANGIGQPEAGTLEALLTATPGPARFIPTHRGQGLRGAAISTLPTRSSSTKNPEYVPLTSRSLTDFDWLAVLDCVTSAEHRQEADR